MEKITKHQFPQVHKWLSKNILIWSDISHTFQYYRDDCSFMDVYMMESGLLYTNCNVKFTPTIENIKYPFGEINNSLNVSFKSNKLNSFKGFPEKIGGTFVFFSIDNIYNKKFHFYGLPKFIAGNIYILDCNFSNNFRHKQKYNLYIDMWFELLESVSDDDKIEYFNNYKDKKEFYNDMPILPKEIINKYKVDFLLKK